MSVQQATSSQKNTTKLILDELLEIVKVELLSLTDDCEYNIEKWRVDIELSDIQRHFANKLAEKQLHHRIRRRYLQLKMRIDCLQRSINKIVDENVKPEEWCHYTGNLDQAIQHEQDIARECLDDEHYGEDWIEIEEHHGE